ncbi:hypothetical protein [Bacteroides sp. 224]|uniref:hypothetical protein n=1 Tax=Bacteroides sp. 224 TaxID=2302936 RepID=UPI0013D43CE3|nr:hypothetical protein [Bacteroides sp. 224]NDV66539.1 hypothetical protein [Bacteroides sp. 224]
MKRITPSVLILIYIIILCACNNENKDLENALILAGDNRPELEKVLSHYSQNPADSLKYKAACFLIENMPGHYSWKDTLRINRHYKKLDSIAAIYKHQEIKVKDSLYRLVQSEATFNKEFVRDIHILTANYLIANIEQSFDVWQNGEWAQHVEFDDFCEYILPYKSSEIQVLDNWREYLHDYCNSSIQDLRYCPLYKNTAYHACEKVNRALKDSLKKRIFLDDLFSVRKMNTLTQIPLGNCEDYNTLAMSVMRAKGIPVVIDHTPQWPSRSLGHSWNVLLETSGKKMLFEGLGDKPGSPNKEERPMAKTFRKTYAINKEILDLHREEKHVPSTFHELCMKDVTEEYLKPYNISVTIEAKHSHKYAYLAVFDNEKWVPIHYGRITKKNKVTFDRMGKRVVYLPVFYESDGIQAFADPILLSISGKQISLKADTLNKQTLTLNRKYPPHEIIYKVAGRVKGGKFQIATDSLFKDSVTLHTITELGLYGREVNLSQQKDSARYWRYYGPAKAHCNIAELFFYEKDSINPTMGRIIGTEGANRKDLRYSKTGVFDRDALTYFDAPQNSNCWVGLDFGKSIKIDRIAYFPRNDGNFIEPGDEYELFYWRNNQWQSLGKKNADYITITYENCPTNALFLLHNHTKGKEERIFTYENGEQVWW